MVDERAGELAPGDARLIYYSEDMRETGQAANFANNPLFCPVPYAGHPLALQLYVIELDNEEAKTQSTLLSSLAKLGAAAYPPASAALGVLDKVGSAFLSGQQDDLIFEFLMEFDARRINGATSTAPLSLPLAEGVYAFVRSQDRNRPIPWTEFELDHRTGHLRCREGNSHECLQLVPVKSADANAVTVINKERRAAYTYFVLEVRRNELAGSNTPMQQTFKEFLELGVAESALSSAKKLTETLNGLSESVVSDSLFDQARADAVNLNSDDPVVKARARTAFASAICAGTTDGGSPPKKKFNGAAQADDNVFYLLSLVPDPINALKLGAPTPTAVQKICQSANEHGSIGSGAI